MVSYVEPSSPARQGQSDGAIERRTRVDERGIEAAVAYEKRHGRDPEVQAHANKGFDIQSKAPHSGDDRLIEVKATGGAWLDWGVGMTHPQFAMAMEQRHGYWLYVVTGALGGAPVVHPIRDPAGQVWRFRFDRKWAEIAEVEKEPD
jgi:hypothetical protein